MFAQQWFTEWLRRPARARRQPRRATRSFRPQVEWLEDRCLLSGVVTNLNDSGSGSLRAALVGGGAVTFDPSLPSGTIFLQATSGPLLITSTTTITGPGANVLTVSGSNAVAVFEISGGTTTLSGLTISDGNSTTGGGGLEVAGTGTVLNLDASVISNCTTTALGGGIHFAAGSSGMITNSTIASNHATAQGGGGIAFETVNTVTVTNCTITQNTAGLAGGGVDAAAAGTLNLTNTTIVANMAGPGGGLAQSGSAVINLTNTIVAENTNTSGWLSPDLSGTISTALNNIISIRIGGDFNGVSNNVNGNQVGTADSPIDPVLGSLAANGGSTLTLAVLPGSPTIAAGTSSGAPATDQRGVSRTNPPDIGAFQSRPFTMTYVSGSGQSTPITRPFVTPLAVSVASPSGDPVAGGRVTFTASLGPGTNPRINIATIAADGSASVSVAANSAPGIYTVTATARGVATEVNLRLENVGPPPPPPPEQDNVPPPSVPPVLLVAVGADAGSFPEVKLLDARTQTVLLDFFAYPPSVTGGVRVAVGDVNHDLIPDLITVPGPGALPEVKVFSGADGSVLYDFLAYAPFVTGGLFVAAGDVNGDHAVDIITGPDVSGAPEVKVFGGGSLGGRQLADFFAYSPQFTGGVRVAAGDVNADGLADVITGTGPGVPPEVKVFSAMSFVQVQDYFAYSPLYLGGIYVAAGDVNYDGYADIVTGVGIGSSEVKVFSGRDGAQLMDFAAFAPLLPGGVRVAVVKLSDNSASNLVVGAGAGAGPELKALDASTLQVVDDFFAFDPLAVSGIFVGG